MSDLTAPLFQGPVRQCEDVLVQWTGGQYPVRVEAFYQPDASSDWKIAGLPSEAADSNVILWNANVPAGTYAWITVVDHSGTYRQTPQGVLVEDSGNATCLDKAQTAPVVTQTVFMSGAGATYSRSNGLDDKALLVLTVCFGILAFAALAVATWLFSRLRQARRARMRGPRFSLSDDEYLGQAAQNQRGGSNMYAAAGYAAGKLGDSRRESTMSNISTSRRGSTMPTYQPETDYREEKIVPSPNTSHSEHNPFLDPPMSAGGDGNTHHSFTSYNDDANHSSTRRHHGLPAPVAVPGRLPRPDFARNISQAGTMSSATSMQIFDALPGQLRVTNDPAGIATPTVSRVGTRSSESSHYPDSSIQAEQSSNEGAAAPLKSVDAQRPKSTASTPAASADGHTYMSVDSVRSDFTADHYASEPHSSKGWLDASRLGNQGHK